ncbi:MAG: hypothetical protein ACREVZ_14070, partial [Burkholderiales bacterium]
FRVGVQLFRILSLIGGIAQRLARRNEHEVSHNIESAANRPEATLAAQHQIAAERKPQRGFALLIDMTFQLIRDCAGLIEQSIVQTRKRRDCHRCAQFTGLTRKRDAIDDSPVKHKPRIILVLNYPVKTKCLQQTVVCN